MEQGTKIVSYENKLIHTVTAAEVKTKKFSDINLSQAALWSVDLSSFTFERCDLTAIKIIDSELSGAKFLHCSMRYSHALNTTAHKCVFSHCDFNSSGLEHVTLDGSEFTECKLTKVRWVDSSFTRSVFDDCKIDISAIWRCNFCLADLSTTEITPLNSIRDTKFTAAKVNNPIAPDKELNMKIYKQIADIVLPTAEAVLSNEGGETNNECLLDMSHWHSECGTKHCLAGWYVKLHPRGEEIEKKSISTPLTAEMLSQDGDFCGRFYSSNEDALEWLQGISETKTKE